MTTRHVVDQLPLWVEGDLRAQEAAAVETHLAACAECRAEAEAFRQSQAWLKGDAAPFTAEDREALRRAVLVRAQAPAESRKSWWAVGLAALAAASLLIILFRPQPPPSVASLPPARPVAPSPIPIAPAPVKPIRLARHRPIHRPIHPPLDGDAGPGASRIEIQTVNPQIRIIWLARATQPDALSHLNKENS